MTIEASGQGPGPALMTTMTILALLLSRLRPQVISSFFLVLLQATHVRAGPYCLPEPVSLPITNVTLRTNALQRGVSLSVGTPAQAFAFLPSWNNNNTFIYTPNCDALGIVDNSRPCITFRGGQYLPMASSTKDAVPSDFNPPPEPWAAKTYKFIADTLHVVSDITLDFVFANPVDYKSWNLSGFDPQNILGMDQGSTLISALREYNWLSTSTFGYWWGLDGVQSSDQQDGALILGGYDKAKTFGDGLTFPMRQDKNCPSGMVVTISAITMNRANGVNQPIINQKPGQPLNMRTCLQPEKPVLMEMPQEPYFSSVLNLISNNETARSNGIDYQNVILDQDQNLYAGGMTFTLLGDFTIKILNHQLIVPERRIGPDGSLYTNGSRPLIRINAFNQTAHPGQMPVLGRYFFTGAYLMGNPAGGNFTLWQANPTTLTSVVAVGDDGDVLDDTKFCVPSWEATLPTGTSAPSNITKVPSGTIAGAAVGAAVAAAAAAAAAIWWFLRRRRRLESSYEQAQSSSPVEMGSDPKPFHEMATPEPPPQELPALEGPHEMAAMDDHHSTLSEMPG